MLVGEERGTSSGLVLLESFGAICSYVLLSGRQTKKKLNTETLLANARLERHTVCFGNVKGCQLL